MTSPRLPNVNDLHAAPELAVLAILETNAYVAVLALGAAHPDLQDLGDTDDLELRAAIDVLDAARALADTINRYRLALALAKKRDELLPF
jgi:hypothetical protein